MPGAGNSYACIGKSEHSDSDSDDEALVSAKMSIRGPLDDAACCYLLGLAAATTSEGRLTDNWLGSSIGMCRLENGLDKIVGKASEIQRAIAALHELQTNGSGTEKKGTTSGRPAGRAGTERTVRRSVARFSAENTSSAEKGALGGGEDVAAAAAVQRQ